MHENDNDNKISINGIIYKTGDKVSCRIQRTHINDARIYITNIIESNDSGDNDVECYMCQNFCDGDPSPSYFEYLYSWRFYINSVNGLEHSDVHDIEKLYIPDCFEYILINAFPRILTYKDIVNGKGS